jgi:BirA family biotin operon repressor/biotin-[acetyl-CoA-carboxylase] ligase
LAAAVGVELGLEGPDGSSPRVGLKWPNDLFCDGRKVGGILCERGGQGDLVAGVGINVRQGPGDFPPELRGRAGSLEMVRGKPVSRSRILGEILAQLKGRLRNSSPKLSSAELEEYSGRDFLAGKGVLSELEGEGTAIGLTPDGCLALRDSGGGLRTVRGGSVFLLH